MRSRRRLLLAAALGVAAVTPALAAQAQAQPRPTEQAPKRRPDVPFVPTQQAVVAEMLRLADVDKNDVLYDLGSGDGRIVITAARERGARGVGVDINPVRIAESRENARRAGVEDRVRFVEGDLFEADLSGATAVTLYLLPDVNLRLRSKLLRELRPGTPVVSHDFDMGEWKPDQTASLPGATVYLWIVPAQVAGGWSVRVGDPGKARDVTLDLKQQFQAVSGSARVNGEQRSLSDVTLRGDELSFTVNGAPEGRLRFRGRVSGDAMAGTVTTEGKPGDARPWAATRRVPASARNQPAR